MQVDLDELALLAKAATGQKLIPGGGMGPASFVPSDPDAFSAFQLRFTPAVALALIARVRELEAERRWIPVSERLPMERPGPMPTDEDEDNPFVPQITLYEVIAAGAPHHAFFGLWPDEDGGVEFGWSCDGPPQDGSQIDDITHWREIGPLPEVRG